MRFRAAIAAAAAVLLLLLGAASAYADHGFAVSKSQAEAGERIDFSISGSSAGDTYLLNVEDQEGLAWGTDFGDGIADWFEMPDFGSSGRTVFVEVSIQPSDPNATPHAGSTLMTYLPVANGGGTALEPIPVPPVPVETQPAPLAEATAPNPTPRPPRRTPQENNTPPSNGNKKPGSEKKETPASSYTPPTTPASTESTGAGSGSPAPGATRGPDVPAGPTGPAVPVAPESTGSAIPVLSPLSGVAAAGKTSFPVLLIILALLVLATVLTAAGPRLWQRYEPQLAINGPPTDDMRLGALSRASAAGAELQKTIAARRASRTAQRVS